MIVGGGTKYTGGQNKVLGAEQAPPVALDLELVPSGLRKDDVQIQPGRGVVPALLAIVPDGHGRYDGPGGRRDAQRPAGQAAGEDAELHALVPQHRGMMRRRRPDAEVVRLLRHDLPFGQRLGTKGRRAGDTTTTCVHLGVLLDRLLLQIPLDAPPRPAVVEG